MCGANKFMIMVWNLGLTLFRKRGWRRKTGVRPVKWR